MTPEQYFATEPSSGAEQRSLRLTLAGRELAVTTAGGVFSGARLDPGTRVLLDRVPDPAETGDLLDLGCGWGPIALSLAIRSPAATVWAVDVNQRARDLAATNAAQAGLANLLVRAPEDVPTRQFATIWSNPPIRIGKPALHQLLLRWLPQLAPAGIAYLVVQRNLGSDSLQRWLSEQLPDHQTVRYASAKGYRILELTAPSPQ